VSVSGTSPATMACANPSATAVLPTPASPYVLPLRRADTTGHASHTSPK